MKVLIVDDHEENLYYLESILASKGFTTVKAYNGQEALDLLEEGGFELIISDILMPVMDGFTFCRRVRKDSRFKRIPFVIYTATYTEDQDKKLALEIGADEFLVKPCEPQLFLQAIDRTLSSDVSESTEIHDLKEDELLSLYNQALIRKLEHKILQVESEIAQRLRMEALLNSIQEYSKIGGWEYIVEEQQMVWTNETYKIHEIDNPDEFTSTEKLIETSLSCYDVEDRKSVLDSFNAVLEKQIPYNLEYRFTTLKGKRLWIRTAASPIFEDGKMIRVLGMFQDITEHKNLEEEQSKLKEQLFRSQKLESIGQLAGGIAHDFNNILAVILGYAEQVLSSETLSAMSQKDVSEIMKAGQRAMKLTKQLLAFSRRQVIKNEVLDLNTIIIELISMLRRLLGENIALETHLEENLGHVKLDSSQLEQVLMNLVINAREAMPHGGKISIQTKSMDLDSEYSGSYINLKPGRYSVLSVSDTGIGMNQETQERIFEPFYTTKTTSQGTGLGLATVYGIVNQSGGTIVVYSEPTKGSTFNLFFPCTQEPLAPQTETLRPMNLQGKGELIMVVEDDASLATLIEKMLNKLNYKTFLVRSATDTLSELKNRSLNPDLILTDVMLEDFNGIELAKQVHLQYPDLKVAYMSGYTNTSIIQTGLLKEGTPFLQKPFSQDELGRCVKKVLAKQGAHQSVKALLIDDDENIHILLGRSFSKRNHVLKGAFGLEDALKELEAEKFDLILLDINIPGSDGFSIIYQLRSLGHTLPIIILSGAYMLLDSYMMTELGIVDFVEKSHDHGPLFASIEQYILPNLKE